MGGLSAQTVKNSLSHQSLRFNHQSTMLHPHVLRPASEVGMQAGSLLKEAHQKHHWLAAARLTHANVQGPHCCRGNVVLSFCCCSSSFLRSCSCSCCSRSSSCSCSYASSICIPRLWSQALNPGSVQMNDP